MSSDATQAQGAEAGGAVPRRVLFLGKREDPRCLSALALLRSHVEHVDAHLGEWGEPLPAAARNWAGDAIISYLSRWIVPGDLLDRSPLSINFHPAPPAYPGIGCVNFALYEEAQEFGVTCHHMVPRVDAGAIVAVRRFSVLPEDDVAALLERAYSAQLELFREITDLLVRGVPLPRSSELWSRRAFTRKEFEALLVILPGMPEAEVRRRIRATSYGPYQPWMELHGKRFVYRP